MVAILKRNHESIKGYLQLKQKTLFSDKHTYNLFITFHLGISIVYIFACSFCSNLPLILSSIAVPVVDSHSYRGNFEEMLLKKPKI